MVALGGGEAKASSTQSGMPLKAGVATRTLPSKLLHNAGFNFIVGWALSGKSVTRGGRKAHVHKPVTHHLGL